MSQIYLEKLQLNNFRNLSNDVIDFSNNINCIFGNNGNGKTNLLEAIYYLVNRKSFRKNTNYQQIINVECENPEIIFSSALRAENELLALTGKIVADKSEWYLNNKLTKKKIGLKTVFINPFDSFSFHSTSAFRRNWVDQYLGLISSEYKSTLSKFTSSLRFRNNLLSKKPINYVDQLKANEQQFIELSYKVLQMRQDFLAELKDYCDKTFKIIFDEVHNLELKVESRLAGKSVDDLKVFYENQFKKDDVVGHTLVGVHRDDYIFYFDGFNSYEYCSLGQQKMSFLSLIFAYIELFRYKFNSYPMVLIDDVSGELDGRRWKNLIDYLEAKSFQVLITTANENFKKELEKIKDAKKIFISDGLIDF